MYRTLIVIFVSFFVVVECSPQVLAQGRGKGRGGGHGGFGSSIGRFGNGSRVFKRSPGGAARAAANSMLGNRNVGKEHAFQVQHWNEERKLAHHQATADRLREISARNGNENLLQTADRLEQKAQAHYDKRMAKIDEKVDLDETPSDDQWNSTVDPIDGNAFETSTPGEGESLDDKLSGEDPTPTPNEWSNSLERRLQNEERKLNHQMDVAQQLREIAAENGNTELLETAARMESMAADRYVKQLDKLGVFDESLPLPEPGPIAPLIDAPPPPGT